MVASRPLIYSVKNVLQARDSESYIFQTKKEKTFA